MGNIADKFAPVFFKILHLQNFLICFFLEGPHFPESKNLKQHRDKNKTNDKKSEGVDCEWIEFEWRKSLKGHEQNREDAGKNQPQEGLKTGQDAAICRASRG